MRWSRRSCRHTHGIIMYYIIIIIILSVLYRVIVLFSFLVFAKQTDRITYSCSIVLLNFFYGYLLFRYRFYRYLLRNYKLYYLGGRYNNNKHCKNCILYCNRIVLNMKTFLQLSTIRYMSDSLLLFFFNYTVSYYT